MSPSYWQFELKTLHDRSGSTASLKEFRKAIKSLADSNQLPDYSVEFDGVRNKITFINRINLTNEFKRKEVDKTKRKRISEYDASKMARPGEEWKDLLKRIGHEYYVIFDKNYE